MNTQILKLTLSLICSTTLLYAQNIYTFAGTGNIGNSGDGGQATVATFGFVSDVAVDPTGNVYIADINNSRIRKINSSGIISAFTASTGGFSGDGGPIGLAQISNAYGIATDASGNLYIADSGNNRIRKVSSSGTITTIAGTGVAGFSGDGAQATLCQLNNPVGITVDASNNVYIVDGGNNRIRKINPSGVITTIAGTGIQGFSGDGGLATNAQLNFGTNSLAFGGIDLDVAGNIYVSDYNNGRIRKISTSNSITTIAGGGTLTCESNSVLATSVGLSTSIGVMVDLASNIYIPSQFNCSYLKKIDGAGIITVFAGSGLSGNYGEGVLAIHSQIYDPWNSAIDALGNIYIVGNGYKVRVICPSNCSIGINSFSKDDSKISLHPNPSNGSFTIKNNLQNNIELIIINSFGQRVLEQTLNAVENIINLENIATGIYAYILLDENQFHKSGKLIIK